MNTLADRVRLALQKVNATQADLAAACQIKPPSVSDWMTGKTKSLKGRSLIKAAKFLRVRDLWLSDGIGPMRSADDGDGPMRLEAHLPTPHDDLWPFSQVTRAQVLALSAEALADVDDHLALVVQKWENKTRFARSKLLVR